MKCVIFAFLVIVAVAMAAPQGDNAVCSPMHTMCRMTDECCRYLTCSFYQAKCVPTGGLVVPGQDKRPLGPGPYPPNVPKDLLVE